MTDYTDSPIGPGPVRTKRGDYEFQTSDRVRPRREIREQWHCCHCGSELRVRRYPLIDPPALFVDCGQCNITWEEPYELSDRVGAEERRERQFQEWLAEGERRAESPGAAQRCEIDGHAPPWAKGNRAGT